MWVSDWIARNSLMMSFNDVSARDAETWVLDKFSPPLIDALYGFGSRVVDDAVATTGKLDAKATSILGWTLAGLSFLLLVLTQLRGSGSILVGVLTGIAVVLTTFAIAQAALALRVVDWSVASEADWFKSELFGQPDRLRAFYVMSMLETHQHHNRQNRIKAEHVRRAQWSLVAAAAMIALLVFAR